MESLVCCTLWPVVGGGVCWTVWPAEKAAAGQPGLLPSFLHEDNGGVGEGDYRQPCRTGYVIEKYSVDGNLRTTLLTALKVSKKASKVELSMTSSILESFI